MPVQVLVYICDKKPILANKKLPIEQYASSFLVENILANHFVVDQ
jgi:hypothetical protein